MNQDVAQKIANFFSAYPLRTFDKRQLLIHAEEPLEDVLYIVDGRVSQYDITGAGTEVVVNVFKPGAFFPMSSALNGTHNDYFFEASTKTTVRQAPAADATRFLRDNPDVALDLLTRVYRGMDGVLRRMAHLMGGDAKTRLLFELLNASARFGELQPDGSVRLSLKEGDIGRHSGLARETVNRCMQELKANGVVVVDHHTICIPDTRRLETMLGTKV